MLRLVELSIATFVAAWFAVTLQRHLGLPTWGSYAICLASTVVLHVILIPLTNRHTQSETPLLDAARQIQKSVPFWLRLLGTLAMGFALAIPFQLLASWL